MSNQCPVYLKLKNNNFKNNNEKNNIKKERKKTRKKNQDKIMYLLPQLPTLQASYGASMPGILFSSFVQEPCAVTLFSCIFGDSLA